jgi:uncharacterized coiled-coil protein SlyX
MKPTMTDAKTLAAELRELANLIIMGSGNAMMHQAADRLEELEEQLAANHAAIKLMGKWLEDERALADRLAAWLDTLLSGYDDAKEIAPFDVTEHHSAGRALAAWKETRHE